jgi:LysR family transcriptional regulator, benzoate and cis,cis-muconate-responsive activator of ben and cat genes
VPEHAAVLQMPGVIYRSLRNARSNIVDLHCIFRRDDESPILRAFLSAVEADLVETNRTKR